MEISAPTELPVKAALRQRFGQEYELTKRLALIGANLDFGSSSTYTKTPVAAICSRQRHTPAQAQIDLDETGHRRAKVLDLHTAETPIAASCMSAKLEDIDLSGLMRDGTIDIYAVSRTTTGQNTPATDMTFWKVVMKGPDGSPYSEGNFLLYIHADKGYPTFPPKARFVTKIKHPDINAHGRICHSILDRDWTSDISMTTLLDSIYGLLLQPEHSDPVSTIATLGFHHDQVEFAEEVRDHVKIHAGKSREEWRRELLGEVGDVMEQ